MTCELCGEENGHKPDCPFVRELLKPAGIDTGPKTEPEVKPLPQEETDRLNAEMHDAEIRSTALTADERKDAANREADANEAGIRLTQTEGGQISDQTKWSAATKVAVWTALGAAATFGVHLMGCF